MKKALNILNKLVAPKDLDVDQFEELREFWANYDHEGALLEAMLGGVVQLHLKYLTWYAQPYVD